MFTHIPTEFPEFETENINGKRYYKTPNGLYPSITSVLSTIPNESLEQWKNSVGIEQANKISSIACSRGTNMHQLCEDYLNNNPLSVNLPDAKELFFSIKPILNKINNIIAQEKILYSDKLKIAGRVDCIAEFDGVLSVIDFKTASKQKKKEDINNYMLQATFYSLALAEIKNIIPKQFVIIIANNDIPQVFIDYPKNYIKQVLDLSRNFHENF